MGNYVSCTLSTPLGKNSKSTKVILPSGEIRQIYEPTKAAELMLETPNFFVVNSQSLKIGRRFSPLNADEDLELANVYVMFPMKRVNSTVTASDMGPLFLVAKRGGSCGGNVMNNKVRALPAAEYYNNYSRDDQMAGKTVDDYNDWRESDCEVGVITVPKLNLDDIEEFSTPEFMHRLSMSRSKKPLLETIAE